MSGRKKGKMICFLLMRKEKVSQFKFRADLFIKIKV